MAKNIRIIPNSGSIYFIGDTGAESTSIQVAINNSSNNVKIYDGQTGQVFVFFDKTNLRTEFSSSMNLYATSVAPPASVGGIYYNTSDGNIYRSNGSAWFSAAGSSGTSGTSGVSGTSGTSGTNGTSGTSGSSGTSGTSGSSGTSGATGAKGNTGGTGAKGQKGEIGSTGPKGATGAKGNTGGTGPKGSTGAKGNTGGTGPKGSTGAKGNTGSPGAKGQKGEVGGTGSKGNTGASGTSGSSGTSGTSGSSGTTGGQGPKGQKGEVGGNGTSGTSGTSGTNGPKGNTGAKGSTGAKGNTGPKGNTGAKGNTGTGTKGQKGETGSNAGITSFTNGADNRVVTATSSTGLNAETNLTYDGTNLYCGGDIIAYYASDARLKDNIQPIEGALAKVLQLNGVKWDWNDNMNDAAKLSVPNTGLIAQEVQAVLPEVVKERTDGYLALDYTKMMGLIVEAIKELANK